MASPTSDEMIARILAMVNKPINELLERPPVWLTLFTPGGRRSFPTFSTPVATTRLTEWPSLAEVSKTTSLPSPNHATYLGKPVFLDAKLTEWVMHPRSPARARRRINKGHRQHMAQRPSRQIFEFCGAFYMHPERWRELRELFQIKA